jgi:hypothetical protein
VLESQTPGGAVLLSNTGDGRYARYFAEFERALRITASWARCWSGGALQGAGHSEYVRGLMACFTLLQSRFTFETNDSLMVDLKNSGYPHSYMLGRLAADRTQALADHLKGGGLDSVSLKQVFLNDLFETGEVNSALLNRIACARYAEVVAGMDGAFDPRFMCNTPVADPSVPKRYRLQWSAFDPTLNMPFLCGMVFEYTGLDLTRALPGLAHVLRHESKAGTAVSTLAHCIDTGTTDIRPLALSRAILGPVHLPGFADPLLGWPQLPGLRVGADPLIEITVDHTIATSSKKPSKLAVTFGVSPAETMVYSINTADPICHERGAHEVERIIMLPHRLLQSIAARERNGSSGYTLIPYSKEGDIQ